MDIKIAHKQQLSLSLSLVLCKATKRAKVFFPFGLEKSDAKQ